jgi:group I intron endonuclease
VIIYKATNKVNGKSYVGKSIRGLNQRMTGHRHHALTRDSQFYFHRAIRKYGWESFEWAVIDEADTKEELAEKEKQWIDKYDSFGNGYNMTTGGDGVSGFDMTDEYRDGMSNLIKEDVIEIKRLLKYSNLSASQLRERFNISGDTLSRINYGRRWKHVQITDNDTFPYRTKEQAILYRYHVSDRILPEETVYNIRKDFMAGNSRKCIREKYDISHDSIGGILSLDTYKEIGVPDGYVPVSKQKRMTSDDEREVLRLYNETNLTQKEIGEMVGKSPSRIGQIIRKHQAS